MAQRTYSVILANMQQNQLRLKLVLIPELSLLLHAGFQTEDDDDVVVGENNTFFENLLVLDSIPSVFI